MSFIMIPASSPVLEYSSFTLILLLDKGSEKFTGEGKMERGRQRDHCSHAFTTHEAFHLQKGTRGLTTVVYVETGSPPPDPCLNTLCCYNGTLLHFRWLEHMKITPSRKPSPTLHGLSSQLTSCPFATVALYHIRVLFPLLGHLRAGEGIDFIMASLSTSFSITSI